MRRQKATKADVPPRDFRDTFSAKIKGNENGIKYKIPPRAGTVHQSRYSQKHCPLTMNDPQLRYKRSPPVHYEALTYSAGRAVKRYPSSTTSTRSHTSSNTNIQPSPPATIDTSRRRRLRPRHDIHNGSQSPRKKRPDALMDLFKVAASILLLSSSAYTYHDHFKFQPVDEVKAGMKIHGHGMQMPATSWARQHSSSSSSSSLHKNKGSANVNVNKNQEGGVGIQNMQRGDVTMKLPPFIQDQTFGNEYDAYGIAHKFYSNEDGVGSGTRISMPKNAKVPTNAKKIIQAASKLREDFASRYGGEKAARAILQKGISSFAPNNNGMDVGVAYMAKRMQNARDEKRPFTFGFAGYSVTAGRGNYFSQSFPFVMKHLLEPIMEEFGVDIHVINAGIGGVPSFPYGFCLNNFLKEDTSLSTSTSTYPLDVVSWDFSMNEANDAVEGMEAYIRQVLSMDQSVKPMLLVKDTHMAVNRRGLIEQYVKAFSQSHTHTHTGLSPDAIVLHSDPGTEPFLEIEEEARPMGFQKWREFGAPQDAPGKSKHHPAVKEHELLGYMIAMYFLSALELVLAFDMGLAAPEDTIDADILSNLFTSSSTSTTTASTSTLLPAPFFPSEQINKSNPSLSSMLYGTETSDGEWEMDSTTTSCRTSFEPIVGGDLRELITPKSHVNDSLDVMLPKGAMIYSKGWVLDLGDAEKKAKQKLNRHGGLGFVDSKKAYYGVFASGSLQLFLPYRNSDTSTTASTDQGKSLLRGGGGVKILEESPETSPAADVITSIILCESNEKRGPMACNMVTDISYSVGGSKVDTRNVKPIDVPGFTYLGRNICVHIKVPADAKSNYKNDTTNNAGSIGEVGVTLELAVSNKKIRTKEVACNISHVVWQHSKGKRKGSSKVTKITRNKQ